MEKIEFNLLKAEIEAQIKEIERLFLEIEERKKGASRSKARLESLAYKLHNLYCAFEDLFKVVAGHFENQVEDIARFHKELLKRMSIRIEGVRPALLSEDAFKVLDELRAFRHFFRHAYSYELRYERLKPVIEAAAKLRGLYRKDIERFLREIEVDLVKTAILNEHREKRRRQAEDLRIQMLARVRTAVSELSKAVYFEDAYVFGSILRPSFSDDSDIDIAFTALKDKDFFKTMAFLSDRLGRDVDIVQLEGHRLREQIIKEGIKIR